nr:glucose 1-dehydrogenase [uncultured Halomonas sp.]
MTARLQDKVALVTGGASGVGRAAVIQLAREGARVIVADIDREAGTALATEIGDAAMFVMLDVASQQAWQSAINEVEEHFGRLDVLVNNAGILRLGSIEEATLDEWRQVMSVNADSVFLGCQTALPLLKRQGGSIVNLSSVAALGGIDHYVAYSASKGAIAAMTRTIATHCRRQKYRIRCNSIHPDGILTPMSQRAYPPGVDPADYTIDADPMNRVCLPEDVAAAIVFLASDESRAINGIELRVDSGQFVMGI